MCDYCQNARIDKLSLETLRHISENHKINFYCVCSSTNIIVYIARTLEEAEIFVNEHKHIELHIVKIEN